MNTEIRRNYYDILEISENATQQEIHSAYKKAKTTYAEENKSLMSVFTNEEANELRTLVDEAFEVLSNDLYRNVYEHKLLMPNVSDESISAESIKTATDNLFQRAMPEVIETTTAPEKQNSSTSLGYTRNLNFEAELDSKKDWTGADLKQVREYKNLSCDEITDITKINPWYIVAVEDMNASGLPVEVFVRGYVIQIAKALGLKDKIVADSYMRHFRKKIEN